MKYTIMGFQQSKLIENELSVEDAFVLRTIKDMYSSASMEFKTIDGVRYMWINYTYLLNQIPIIGSKRNLMRRIETYSNKVLLLRVLEKSRNGVRGNYAYIAPTKKLDELQDYDLMTKSHKAYDRNDIRVVTESHNKDTSIKDYSIRDNKYIAESNDSTYMDKPSIDSHFEKLWKSYPSKKGKAQVKKTQRNKLYKISFEELERCIERYKQDVENQRNNGFSNLKYQNGSTFFNGGYVDYMDENWEEPQQASSKAEDLSIYDVNGR